MIEAIIGAVGSFITRIFTDKLSGSKKLNKWDERLANKFLNELPSSSSAIGILKEQDFEGSFSVEYFKPLNRFHSYWTDPDHQFNNKKLNAIMSEFIEELGKLKALVGQHTAPVTGQPHNQRIYYEYDDPKREEFANAMNNQSSSAFDAYTKFCSLIKKYDFEPVN